jgi:uncharacterized protein involved in exopolysaccharide biosynthesis
VNKELTNSGPQAITLDGQELAFEDLEERAARERMLGHLRLLWQSRGLLLRVALAGFACSVIVALLLQKRYEATARLMPPDDRSTAGFSMLAASVVGQAGALGPLANDILGVKRSGALFVGILGSRTVENRLIDRFELKQTYRTRLYEDARKRLEANTSIAEDRKSGIITIKVTDTDPKRAAALAGAYVEELDRLVAQLSTSSAHRERVFLEDRLKSVKQDLDAAAERLGEFSSKNTTIDIPTQGKAMLDAAAQLQGQLIAAQAQLQGLRQIYTNNNVHVREGEARIAELEHQLEKLGGVNTSPGKSTSAAYDAPLYPSIKQLPLLGITYADLYRRTKVEEAVYETLTQLYELAKVQEAKETPSVKVLDAAIPPEEKSYPPRTLIVELGTAMSLAIAAVWILASAFWTASDPSAPGKRFVLEVAGDARNHLGGLAEKLSFASGIARRLSHRPEKSVLPAER